MRRWAFIVFVLVAVLVLPAMCGCGEPGHIEATTGAGNTMYSIGFQFKVPAAGDISSALKSAAQTYAPEAPQPAPTPAPAPTPVVSEPEPEPEPEPQPDPRLEPDPWPEPQPDPCPS